MKKKSFFKSKLIAIFALLLIIVSCKTEFIQNQSENDLLNIKSKGNLQLITSKNKLTFNIKNGVLKVDSLSDLYDLMDYLVNLKREERLNWAKNINFVSMQDLYEDIITEEFEIFEQGEKISSKAKDNFSKTGFVSEKGVLNKNLFKRSNEEGILKNLDNDNLAYVLNKEGIALIGDSYYKFEKNKISIVKESKLNNSKLSDIFSPQSNKVKIINTKNLKGAKVLATPDAANFSRSNVGAIGSPQTHKVLGYYDFLWLYDGNQYAAPKYSSTYRIKVLKRGLFGAWFNVNTQVVIEGTNSFYGNKCSNSTQGGGLCLCLTCGCNLDNYGQYRVVYKIDSGVSETTTSTNIEYNCYTIGDFNYMSGTQLNGTRIQNVDFKAGYNPVVVSGNFYVTTNVNGSF